MIEIMLPGYKLKHHHPAGSPDDTIPIPHRTNSMAKNDPIEIACELHGSTPAALLISDDGERKVWIPRSQIVDEERDLRGRLVGITIPEWLAEEKELI